MLNTLVNAKNDEFRAFPQRVKVTTAASPPPPSIIEKIEARGFEVLHLYGLTEVFGPMTICEWQNAWNDLPASRRAEMKARQGVAYPSVEEVRVVDPKTMIDVPNDGTTIGEVVEHPQLVARGLFTEADSPVGPIPVVRCPLSGRAGRVPGLGDDTDAVLAEAGYDAAQIAELRTTGVV